ncbi:lipopolysaccharide biosynthesis protein [Microbacterium enclense]|uniref:Lipopolysaccharide biosynthesis protein n=1 Tax=Microbacterium enclense TaxID=993073 RepID=A0A3S3L8W5_9MICO|nr:lipopolysaccharide biosynthesis protein [Microbacterium enclense]RWR19182.1 lipopolysaccharide biosynthesis protein [Microbacterium enclense]
MTTLSSSAARGGAVTLGFQAVRLVIMFSSLVVLARLIDPASFGLMAMVTSIIGVAEIFRDFGLSMAALQARDLTRGQQSNLWWINFGIGCILTAAVFAMAYPIAAFYGEPDLVPVVQVMSVTFLLGGASTQFRVHINRGLRFVALSVTDVGPYLLSTALAIVLAASGFGLWALVAQQVGTAVFGLILAVMLARWFPGLPRRGEDMSTLLRFGVSLAATQVLGYATRNVDSIAIGRAWGPTALGSYDRAYQLMVLPINQINTPLSRVAVPVLSKLKGETERLAAYVRQAQLVALYVTGAIFSLLAALGPQIVFFVLGPEWSQAGTLVSLLAIGGVFRSLVQICFWIYMSQGYAAQQLRYFVVSQPLLIGVMLTGLPWGAQGVALMFSVAYALYWAASLLWVGRVASLDVRPMFVDVVRALLAFAAPGALAAHVVARVTEGLPAPLPLALGLVVALVWYGLAWAFIPRVRRDLDTLRAFARKAISRRSK